jgi:hypothetical protein
MNLRRVTNLELTRRKTRGADLLVDPHKILNRWKNYFCQLLDVHGAGGVRQTEIQSPVPLRWRLLLGR